VCQPKLALLGSKTYGKNDPLDIENDPLNIERRVDNARFGKTLCQNIASDQYPRGRRGAVTCGSRRTFQMLSPTDGPPCISAARIRTQSPRDAQRRSTPRLQRQAKRRSARQIVAFSENAKRLRPFRVCASDMSSHTVDSTPGGFRTSRTPP
jgi:hypothetical protein